MRRKSDRSAQRWFRLPRRGQALVEYSVVTFILAVGGIAVLSFPIGTRGNLLQLFWEGLNAHYDSVYYVLQCSFP